MTKVVFVGDFDCGKSTLIGRLIFDTNSISKETREEFQKISEESGKTEEFSYLLDSFEEERRNELTIDTTQAFLKCKDREYLLIDVPGHKELLKNMLTGASYADFAIVICDVEKPLEEQLRRHIFVLKFLGINQFILAINKMDRVDFTEKAFENTVSKILEFSGKIDMQAESIIPISAKEGDNLLVKSRKMNWYHGPLLLEAIDSFRITENNAGDFRFPVQDVYQNNGEQVIVGTIVSGEIRRGDKIKIALSGLEYKVNNIMVFGKNKSYATAKESIGLQLDINPNFALPACNGQAKFARRADRLNPNGFNRARRGNPDRISFAKFGIKERLRRGQVIYKGRPPQITTKFSAKIFCILPISEQNEFILRCNTQALSCVITQVKVAIDTATLESIPCPKVLKETNAAEVVIETYEPLVIERFREISALGRFILSRSEQVFACGIIL